MLIGGAACDIVFENNDTSFRATRDFELREMKGITPVHIDDAVSSLSAILLDDNYYKVLLDGKINVNGLSVLRPEYLILFKAKAYLDLKNKKENGETVDSNDIKKHKKDVLRIAAELMLGQVKKLPGSVKEDLMHNPVNPDFCDRDNTELHQF